MLKVFIQKEGYTGGPKNFRDRLRSILRTMPEVKLVDDGNDFDIELAFIRAKKGHKKPVVLRIDGCYYRKKDLGNNVSIFDSIARASHVIFQSNFSSQMCRKIMKVEPPSWSVIYNGIDQKYIDSIAKDESVEPGSFVACSNTWKRKPNKRPVSTIRGFLEAGTDRHLYVIGKYHSEWPREFGSHVHFCGLKSPDKVIAIMKACDYQIHLCHIDSCPNAVVEGLSCGLNVLCTNLGGTPELVRESGVILNIDNWAFNPLSTFDNLDTLNSKKVAEGISSLLKFQTRANRPDLNIEESAKQYIQVLSKVVNG